MVTFCWWCHLQVTTADPWTRQHLVFPPMDCGPLRSSLPRPLSPSRTHWPEDASLKKVLYIWSFEKARLCCCRNSLARPGNAHHAGVYQTLMPNAHAIAHAQCSCRCPCRCPCRCARYAVIIHSTLIATDPCRQLRQGQVPSSVPSARQTSPRPTRPLTPQAHHLRWIAAQPRRRRWESRIDQSS